MNIGYSDENEPQAVICMFVVIFLIIGFGFTIGWAVGYDRAEIDINDNICKHLYSDTNEYLNCKIKNAEANVKLIQYIK